MLIPNYQELFEPYTDDGCTVDKMIQWAAKNSGVPREVMDAAVKNLFFELSQGKTFSTEGCDCGCEIGNAHTAINHYFLREILILKEQMAKEYWQVLENMQKSNIMKHIELENAKYAKRKMTPWYRKVFADWVCDLFGGKPSWPH